MPYKLTYTYYTGYGKTGSKKVSYDCPNRKEVDQLITEISRLALKRDFVEVELNGQLVDFKQF
jgi:hypothetical protein